MPKNEMMKTWQDRWHRDIGGGKYYNVQKSIHAQSVSYRKNRREETVLTRLRFDHMG